MVRSRRFGQPSRCGMWLLACASVLAALNETEARRTQMAIELLPRLFAVDLDADKKLTGDVCSLLLVFAHDRPAAESYPNELRQSAPILRRRPVLVSIARANELAALSPPAALLVVEPLAVTDFAAVKAYARRHQRILFSPFSGDVECGATAGVYIGARVLLQFNLAELQNAGVRIELQVLRISKFYE